MNLLNKWIFQFWKHEMGKITDKETFI